MGASPARAAPLRYTAASRSCCVLGSAVVRRAAQAAIERLSAAPCHPRVTAFLHASGYGQISSKD
eukprot:5699145-Pleurochrysis_carterae.AAC.1